MQGEVTATGVACSLLLVLLVLHHGGRGNERGGGVNRHHSLVCNGHRACSDTSTATSGDSRLGQLGDVT